MLAAPITENLKKTDAEVRFELGCESIDSILRRSRLVCICRLTLNRPESLLAILASKPHGVRLPWVETIIGDMRWLVENVTDCKHMPDPIAYAGAWVELMRNEVKWFHITRQVWYSWSSLDNFVSDNCITVLRSDLFVCDICPPPRPNFSSTKELLQHKRVKHGHKSKFGDFISCGVCPVCGNDYVTRLRCLKHAADGRP